MACVAGECKRKKNCQRNIFSPDGSRERNSWLQIIMNSRDKQLFFCKKAQTTTRVPLAPSSENNRRAPNSNNDRFLFPTSISRRISQLSLPNRRKQTQRSARKAETESGEKSVGCTRDRYSRFRPHIECFALSTRDLCKFPSSSGMTTHPASTCRPSPGVSPFSTSGKRDHKHDVTSHSLKWDILGRVRSTYVLANPEEATH